MPAATSSTRSLRRIPRPTGRLAPDPRRAVLFGSKEAAIAARAALSVDSKLAISVSLAGL